MPGDISGKHIMTEEELIAVTDLDRFRPSLKCDLFIPSYVHSLSVATEFVYNYVLSKFPENYFQTIHVAGKHPFEDFRRLQKGDLAKRENPAIALSYTLRYDFNDNNLDFNLLGTNKYLKRTQWQRSFFKCPHNKLYIGMDLETMMIDYNFRFRVNTRAQQLDLYNRLRKVFRLGCTETNDIDCDFHLDRGLITEIAMESGYNVDAATGEVDDPWNFTRFLNSYSQMPILYKLRTINQHYEYFLRMRNLPVHMDFQNPLDVDDGSQIGMVQSDFNIDFQVAVRFPAPRIFALYNEGKWVHKVKVEENEGIQVYSMKVIDIPEENYAGWPIYGHSNYLADEGTEFVKEIPIRELFKAPVDVKIHTSLDDFIEDSLRQFISPDSFIEVALYTNNIVIGGNGRIPIKMDWENRKIILPDNILDSYFYIAVYIDRNYVNSKIIEISKADKNRISMSLNNDLKFERMTKDTGPYNHEPIIEDLKQPTTNFPKKPKKAMFIVNKRN